MTHTHRAIKTKAKDYGWTHCVLDHWHGGASHGCIVRVDECKCGAVRKTEINGVHRDYGQWKGNDETGR